MGRRVRRVRKSTSTTKARSRTAPTAYTGRTVIPELQLLEGLASWEWVGMLLARVVVGLLFLLSGAGKLFRVPGRQRMVKTLQEAGVPFPELNALVISTVEFVVAPCSCSVP